MRSPRLELKSRSSLKKEDEEILIQILSKEINTRYVFGGGSVVDIEHFTKEMFTYDQPLITERRVILTQDVDESFDPDREEFIVSELTKHRTGLGVLVYVGSNEVVGFAGILSLQCHDIITHFCQLASTTSDIYEFGFVLDESKWGLGLATEIGKTQIEFAFNTLDIQELFGLTHPENVASIRVLQGKLGLKHLGKIELDERGPREIFSITRQQYQKRKKDERSRLLSYNICDLDINDPCLMKQWQDMHLEWLRRFDLWEPADQVTSMYISVNTCIHT